MGHAGDLQGKSVSEAEVAAGLGFVSVYELRRWQTECGRQLFEAQCALGTARDEANRFRWHGLRMQQVLTKIRQTQNLDERAVLAIDVVCGRAVDWGNEVRDWTDLTPWAVDALRQLQEPPEYII